MKLNRVLGESRVISETAQIIEDHVSAIDELETMLEDIQEIREWRDNVELDKAEIAEIDMAIDEIQELLESGEFELINEKVQRQFRRYGDTFKRQYRCTTGDKAGRMVTSPEKCGIRKDPKKVRQGKKASRVKKGQRIRKSLFTKRKTQSKRLSRLNKRLRGE